MTISLKKFKPTFDITDARKFELVSDYSPSGDQPKAIENLCKGLSKKQNDQGGQTHRAEANKAG